MKILKFGGKSLSNNNGITTVLTIIEEEIKQQNKIAVILSARGNTTDQLELILNLAKQGKSYQKEFVTLKKYQTDPLKSGDILTKEFERLAAIFEGVSLVKDYSLKTRDLVLAQGELMAIKVVTALLNQKGNKAQAVDSRLFLKTNNTFGNALIDDVESKRKIIQFFNDFNSKTTPIISGFIASTSNNETTTLGRNGSNYSASLIANYLNADLINSYTHINGIYTANPELVLGAKIITQLNYKEASALASFGASILHAKTIAPLEDKNIPIHILNTFNRSNSGTLIDNQINDDIKSISVQDDVGLINFVGKGLLGKKGIDARIFTCLSNQNINIGIISQGASESGVDFVISETDLTKAKAVLKEEFKYELFVKDVEKINIIKNVNVITVIGQDIASFSKSLKRLKRNNIKIKLLNTADSSNNISLVVEKEAVKKAINIIHSQIFEIKKQINIAVFGIGTVGEVLINQILEAKDNIAEKKAINLNIIAIANSKKILLNEKGVSQDWKKQFANSANPYNAINVLIEFVTENHLENLIAIDNTASKEFVTNYETLIQNGFDLISSNKIANTLDLKQYKSLRSSIIKNNKQYLYETNVGAGLPIIDTIQTLHSSNENITQIRGVFSGSLSYLFNEFSNAELPFSHFLKKAIKNGYTEPDPREDLNGNDVARKLLILARELDLENEFDDIVIENLIPKDLRTGTINSFLRKLDVLDEYFSTIRLKLKQNEVLRYVGSLTRNHKTNKGVLTVRLAKVDKLSTLGSLKGSDNIFEIYTTSYGLNPITIIGAGAGAEVTARGVFGDLLHISKNK